MNSIVRSVSADALLDDESTGTILVPFFVRDGESKTFRPISRDLAQVGQHFRNYEETGSGRPYLCLGEGVCAACLGGRRPTLTFLMPALYPPTRTLGVLSFGDASGPDSLRRQIGQLLRLPDYTQKLFDLSRRGKKYTLKITRTITEADDGEAYGLDVLREVAERGDLTSETMAATVDRLSNADMIEESSSLRGELSLRHPGLDVTTL